MHMTNWYGLYLLRTVVRLSGMMKHSNTRSLADSPPFCLHRGKPMIDARPPSSCNRLDPLAPSRSKALRMLCDSSLIASSAPSLQVSRAPLVQKVSFAS